MKLISAGTLKNGEKQYMFADNGDHEKQLWINKQPDGIISLWTPDGIFNLEGEDTIALIAGILLGRD